VLLEFTSKGRAVLAQRSCGSLWWSCDVAVVVARCYNGGRTVLRGGRMVLR